MKSVCHWLGGAVLFMALLGAAVGRTQDAATQPKVDFKVVKYDQVAEEVQKHKGKVVVVDAWGIFCPPCIKGLPHLVEMSRKYADKGLVAITLHVDPPYDAETKAQAPKILGKLNATTTTNLVLDEPSEVWQQKLHSNFIPIVFVFDREGKWTQFTNEGVDYDAIEKLVVKLLAQK
jgi:thiol-disulfide isomerase/thioredoxin